ncbi:HAD-IA family hydrolase [Candidatus Saccharibacteria bacterium]|nr:MAG: HAD-IA family hydrolase [Candidatus Saccharibacteria bacterium]
MDEKRLGAVVQHARRAAGFTQQSLCQRSGLSYSTLAKIERGAIKAPSVFTIQQIATTLGVTLDELLADVSNRPKKPVEKRTSVNGVQFVYFDMNGCLVRGIGKAFAKLAEESGASPDTVETFFWQHNDAVCRGEKTVDELNTALAERLGIIVDWYQYYLDAQEAMPGMNELVAWVSENYRVGILTNTMPGLIQPMLDRGLLPSANYEIIIDSSVVHAMKPEERIYQIAAEKTRLAPNQLLLIDDDRPNLVAAGGQGWNTMKFQSYQPEESIAAIYASLQPVA